MIYSMTAFSRTQEQSPAGGLVCEIRSINHRYLEIGLHLPDILRVLEMPIRDLIRKHIKRGKIECTIRYQATIGKEEASFKLNARLAQELANANEQIAGYLKHPAPTNTMDILRYPGVMQSEETDVSELQKEVLELLEKTLIDLVAARGREGEELKQLFIQRMNLIGEELSKVRDRLPQVIADQNDRLRKRFLDVKLEIDPARLEQEIVIFAHKVDVAEEIDRTETHVTEVKRILEEGGMVGRRLDFLSQELNREANTLGSKSVDPIVTRAAVEMKVLIEQVREQIQNIE